MRERLIMMPKSDTIAAIMELNPTANPAFLAEFSVYELGDYLHRLTNVTESREATARTGVDRPAEEYSPAFQ
jgi:hypothetical protein